MICGRSGRRRLEKAFIFMVRLRVPGGVMAPAQWLAMERIARERGNGTLRLTTRQTIQFHGVIKGNLQPAIRGHPRGAAGHDRRLWRRQPQRDRGDRPASRRGARRRAGAGAAARQPSAAEEPGVARDLDRWRKVVGGAPDAPETEPIYGPTYMPRKFKIAIAVPPTNDVDVFAHDLGFIAIEEGGAALATTWWSAAAWG